MSTKLVVCPKCGAENASVDRKCVSCTASLKGAETRIINHHLDPLPKANKHRRWRFIVVPVLAVLMAGGIIYANANTQPYGGSNTGVTQQPPASAPPAKAQPASPTSAKPGESPVVNSTSSSSSAASKQAINYAQNCISQGQTAVQEENNYINQQQPPIDAAHAQYLANAKAINEQMLAEDPADGAAIVAHYNSEVAQENASYATLSQGVKSGASAIYQTYMTGCD